MNLFKAFNITKGLLLPASKKCEFRFMSLTALNASIRDDHRTGVRIKQIDTVMEGTVGTERLVDSNT
jgi:hypothetical protein